MKRMKLVALIMCFVTVFTSLAGLIGCGGGRDEVEQVDTTKTQLEVGNFGGGMGESWLYDLKSRFEEKYKDTEFEPGKKGVQVMISSDKEKYSAKKLLNTIPYESKEIFFPDSNNLDDLMQLDYVLDVDDIVREKLTAYGETKSIEDKMDETQRDHFMKDGKYYGVPNSFSSLGCMYDVDLYEEKRLFFAKNGCPSEALQEGGSFEEYAYVGATGERSAGPDGKYGTYDDGCAATFEEFEELLSRMKTKNIKGIIWTGKYADTYSYFLPSCLKLDYHGNKEGMISYNLGGTEGIETDVIRSFDADGNPVVTREVISLENYKDAVYQAGNYYGLKLMEILIKGDHVSHYAFEDLDHLRTQDKFLVSSRRLSEEPISMMIEGTWWENEAESAGTFNNNVEEFGEEASRLNRNFSLMPMPKATLDKVGTNPTVDAGSGVCFISKFIKPEKVNVAKKFLQFTATDESLRKFTVISGIPKGLNYDLTEDDISKMTKFAKGYWDYTKSADKIYPYESNEVKNTYGGFVRDIDRYVSRKADNSYYSLFVKEAHFYGTSAREYYEGMIRNAQM